MSSLKDFNVNDLDFENMGSWPIPVKIIAGVIVFILVIILGYQLLISDDELTLETEISNELTLKQQFETKQRKAVHLDAYKNQMKMIQENFKSLLKQLPRSSEVAGLVDEVTYAAKGAGLEMNNLALQDEVNREIYIEQAFEIVVSGGYHQIAEFVSKVSNMPRILTLHNFEIIVTDREVYGSEGDKLLTMKVIAKTYRYDDIEE